MAVRVIADLRSEVLHALLGKALAFHQRERTGEHVSMVTSDIAALEGVLGTVPGQLVRLPLMVAGGVVLMARTSFRLTLLRISPQQWRTIQIIRSTKTIARIRT